MDLDLRPADATTILGGVITASPRVGALQVDVGEVPGAVVLALQGEADLATAAVLADALMNVSEGTGHVVLDAANLRFIDAYCLGVIASARARLRDQGRDLTVRSPASLFRRVLTMVAMEDLIEPQRIS